MVHKTIYLYPVVGFEVTNSTKSHRNLKYVKDLC